MRSPACSRRCGRWRGERDIAHSTLASELAVLATELLRIARADRRTRDYTFNKLRQAIAAVAARFPVYRTCVAGGITAQDRRYIDWAVAHAAKSMRAADTTIVEFLRLALRASPPKEAPPQLVEHYRRSMTHFPGALLAYGTPTGPADSDPTEEIRGTTSS